ncbi:MAG: vanadium-dependent haloperoxidase [Acidobacteria bacterium]|nr:vanadium-dependent haloperoxidase [Acidobacteriota bacterium]
MITKLGLKRRGWLMLMSVGLVSAFVVPLGASSEARAQESLQREEEARRRAFEPSAAYDWVSVFLDVSADEVNRNGARTTIISRNTFITVASMFQAWAAYDARAVGTELGKRFRRPRRERTLENREIAIGYAAYRAMLDIFPEAGELLRAAMLERGLDPDDDSQDVATPQGVGNVVAAAVIAARQDDGSNADGTEPGSSGAPFSDYTGYQPVNSVDVIVDPDRWQPITFTALDGTRFTPSYLTPHWGLVEPFGLTSPDQFRPPPPPLVGSEQLEREVRQVVEENADLSLEEKAIVEFMRDGPQSTSQSGQWLTFGQFVSLRDRHGLDRDMKMYFALAAVGLDAFIASWEAKLEYDSSRPYTLVRHYFEGETLRGWGGPGRGTVTLPAEQWQPYSPGNFVTPPFPGYVSGHSTVSGASARLLELFTGSDEFGVEETWVVGSLTEPGIPCYLVQQVEGEPLPPEDLSCEVTISLPTFSATAEAAGFSRILGGFHIQSDNLAGLELGRQIADHDWDVIRSYFEGRAPRR